VLNLPAAVYLNVSLSAGKQDMATSSRTRAYDPDLRWRMIYQQIVLELPFKTISQNLYVEVSTVRHTVELFNGTGSVDKQPYPEGHSRQCRKLAEGDQLLLLELVLEHPDIYLHELRHKLHASGIEA